ncbi:hypothetical protein SSX86_032902 [Deinandra increscens subsp. villosa]|uniref:Uncharacterized protein n=1 Tax=Deinandra increscens subsp. villosa TaxID=3103831 RepID=A0AAP0GH99_9ASTR
MFRRSGAITISVFANSTTMVGWCRPPRRRLRRRKSRAATIRIGNKNRRRWRWRMVACPFVILKKLVMKMVSDGRFMEAYYLSLPILRPQLFPMC